MKNFNSFMWLRGYGLKRVGRILACLTLLLTLVCGNVWGATYYVIPAKCNVSAGALVAGADGNAQLFKTDESTVTVNTDISTSVTATAGVYYNSTSTTYANLTNTSNYSTSSGSSRTMRGIKLEASVNCTITVNTKRFSKLDVIYRCASNDSKTLTIDGVGCNTSDKNFHLKSITKAYSSNIIISNGSDKEYDIFVILTETAAAKMVYLKNSMGWATAYVNRLGTSSYWDGTNGSGCNGRNGTYAMSYDSDKQLFYYEAAADASDTYLCFTKDDQSGYNNFFNTEAVYVDGGYEFGKVVWVGTSTTFSKNGTKYYGEEDHTKVNKEDYSADVFLSGSYNSWAKNAAAKFTEGTPYTKTVSLTAGNVYTFKVVDNAWFGNPSWLTDDKGSMTFSQTDGDLTLLAGITGDYTFTYNRSTHVVAVDYPAIEHPSAGYIYLRKTWDHCHVHWWYNDGSDHALTTWGSDPEITTYTTICEQPYYYFPLLTTYNMLIGKDAAGDAGDGGNNKTGDMNSSSNGGKYIAYNSGWGWNNFATYTISYGANGGGSSMSSETGICPNGSQALTSNAFTPPSGCASFSHWTANVNVTANGTPVTAGNPIADGATLSNINSNIALTAVWKLATPTITQTANYNNFTISGSIGGASYYYTTDNSTPTTSSSLYSSAVDFDADITAKAIAHKTGYVDSDVASQACKYINCSISSCGNATLTYTINGSTSVNNTAANLVSATNASNTTALGVPAASSAVTLSTMEFDGEAGKAVAKANGCYTTSLIMSSKLSVHNGSSFNTSHYLQFAFTVKDGYTFTPCDIQFVVQPTTYSTDFRWEITDGTSTYGYGTASGVGTGSDAGATVLTGLTSPSMMSAGTYYIRLYPKFKKDGKTNYFRIGDEVILKGTTAAAACTAPTTVDVSATVNEVAGYWFYPGDAIVLTATPTGSPAGSPVTYQWKNGGVDIVGATSSTYSVASATKADAGNYTCTISYGACSTTSASFQMKCMQFYLKNSGGSDISNHALQKVDATHATLALSLTGGTTYNFRVTDGCNDWYGNSDATGMTSSNCTNWTMPHDADCRITTNSTTGDYTFLFDFTDGILGNQMKVSVVYPGGDQASGKTIYWDNSVLNWAAGNQWYRIGTKTGNTKTQMTLVPGTANLYKVTTAEYLGFQNWHIANNEGEGTGNVFWTKDSDPTTSNEEITAAMAYDGTAVSTAALTVTPTTTHATGATSDNNNCEFYTYSKMYVMKTDAVSITAPSNGTITVAYTDVAGVAQSFTSGSENLAHTVIITPTATPATGYDLGGLTVNAVAHTSGNTYTCSGATVVAATFTPHVYTITLNKGDHGASNQSASVAYLDDELTSITHVTSTGYTLTGYYDGSTKVLNANGSFAGTDITGYIEDGVWTKTADATLTAKWEAMTTTLTFDANTTYHGTTGDGGATATYDATALASVTHTTPAAGYQLDGYYTTATGEGTKIVTASGTLVASTSYTTAGGAWQSELANLTLYARYTDKSYSVTHTFTNASRTSGGSAGASAATHGTDYSVIVAATSGYTLPSTITVTIGGETATSGTEYTWNQGTGTVTIDGDYITGDIEIEIIADVDVTTYSVTYAAGVTLTSGDVPDDVTDLSNGDQVTIADNTGEMVYGSYAFRGWTDGTTFYQAGDKITISGSDVDLTAVWDGGTSCTEYEVLLSNGSVTQESSTKPYGQYITGRGKIMRKGDGSDATTLTEGGSCHSSTKYFQTGSGVIGLQTYNAINKVTVYAIATGNRTLSSIKTGTTLGTYGDDIQGDCTVKINGSTDTPTSHVTWSKDECGEIEVSFPNTLAANSYILITFSGNLYVYGALFENCAKSNFTVSFADGSTAPASHLTWPDDIEGVPTGKKILQPSTTPTASGYIFGGWYTNANCTTAVDFSTMTITADKTLYAKWTAKTQPTQYSVTGDTYYCPSGTATITLANSQSGINYQLLKGGAASGDPKAGTGSALEWEVNAAGTYTVKAVENATYSEREMSGSVTVAAYAAASISTQPTTAVAAAASEDFTVGSGMVVAGNGLSYQWYTCLSDGSSASSISGAESSTYTTSKSKGTYYFKVGVTGTCGSTVYSNVITVTVTASHSVSAVTSTGTTTYGTVAAGSSSVAEGATTTITASPATGYQVTNWAVSGTGASISPSGSSNSNTTTLTMGTADATVTVTFGAKTYSVTLDRGIGSSGSSSVTMTYNSSSHTSITAPTAPTGYTFAGWYSGEGGTGSQVMNASGTLQASVAGYTDGSGNWTKKATCTLYAKYTANYPSGYLYITDVMATPETGATASATDASFDASLDGSFSHSGLAHWAKATVKSSGVYTLTFASPITAGATAAGVAVDVWWGVDNTSNASTYIYLNGTSDSDEIGHYKSSGESQRKTLLEQLKNVQKVGTTSVSSLQLKCNDNPGSTWFRVGIKEIPGYQLTYNANEGSGAPSASYQPNATITLSSTVPTRSGYRFLGWNTEDDGSGTHYASGASFSMPATATTLYAEWQEAATLEWLPNVNTAESSIGTNSKTSTNTTRIPTSNMSAISNYGSLTITSSSKADLTSKIQAPTSYDAGKYMYVTFTVPSGYEFVPSNVSVKVQPVDAAGDVKLELIDASAHSISKTQSSVASGSISTVTMTNGSSVAFKGTVTLKIYCYGASTGTYRLGSPIAISGDINELEGYTVTYDDNGSTSGSVPVDASSPYDEDATVTVLGNTGSLAKNGYTFNNWNTENDGSGDPYKADDTFEMPAEDVVLYAQWTPNTYDITYNLDGASWAGGYSAPANYTVGTGATLPVAGNMTNTGYTFGGWYDNSGLTGSAVTTISTSDYDDKEFWAKWTENEYTITYDANNVSATGSTSDTEGHYVTVADCGFELDGHMFAGWNTKSDGTGDPYSAGDEIELTANMTLYAQWGDDYTISWDASAKLNGVAATPNLGGGNYTITASVADWTGTLTTSMISALTDGVTITNVAVDNSSSPKTITATFNVGASVAGESISFELDVPAAGDFGAKSSTKDIDIDRCTGSSSGSDGVLFSAEFKDSGLGTSNICAAANTPFTFTTDQLKAAPTGGSISAYTTNNLSHMTYVGNAISIAGSDGVIEITLDNAIATNDLFTYLNVNSSSSSAYLRHTSADNTTDQITLTVYNNKEAKVRLTSGFNGKTTLYIVRKNNNFNLHKAAVIRPAFLMLLRDDTPTASSTNLEGTDVELTTSTYLSAISGGRTYFTSPSEGNLKIKRSDSKNYINFNNAAGYVKVVLNDALQEGDVIGFDSYNTNNLAFTATAERSTTITTTNQLYTVTSSSALKGQTTFYIWQYSGSSDFLRGLQIARSGVAGGSGGSDQITPTLTWTPALESDADWDGTNSRLAKETGDADFTFTVTQDKNSLGAITYASSNTSVATVTSAGKVHIVGAGEATITATMAESGCYEEATAEYDIYVVDNCEDAAGTITVKDLGCATGYELTVSGHTIGDAVTYQWYKDGVSMGGSYVAAKCTVTVAGEYYVVVDNTGSAGSYHCAMASTNTITIEATEAATASAIVDSWYIKNGRRTPDIALVQTENATDFTVKSGSTDIWNSDGSVTTGFAGCGFYLGTDGIIYLKGQKADGTAPSGLTAGEETLTFIATSCGGNADDVEITIHKQAATTRPSVAFVVDGTKEGVFDAENEDHSVGTALYDYLDYTRNGSGADGLFDLTPQNVYSTVDEKAIRQHYSQFDAIIITDDPSTSTKIGKKSCVDAFGTMVDIRPILTMEAYVSSLANWKAKGISGNPTSPNPRQYAMKLECKDHAIFSGLDPASDNVEVETVDGVDYWTVTMVDKTKTPYDGLDDDEETGGAEKPALQGFSASNVDGLLLLGEISEGTLYTGVERQDEPAARLMLLGVQYKALPSALTPEGLIVIKNALNYLLETDMEEVDDCSNYFTDATGDHLWSTNGNWSKGKAPDVTVKARILKPCIITGTAYAAQVDIATGGKSSKGGGIAECTGKLTIDPTGALIVGGEVRAAEAPYFNTGELKPTTANDLVLNTNGSNQSALIFDNDKGDTKATVNLYSLGRKPSSYLYQYFAIPMESLPVNPTFANETHGGTKIYTYAWEEGTSSWTRRKYYDDLYAFEGLGITTNSTADYMSYTMSGNLASTAERVVMLTYDGVGNNIIGNSYTAPINIASLITAFASDEHVTKTVYVYCAGRDASTGTGASGSTETAGQWLAIPMNASGWETWEGLKVIPAMQAFLIQVTAETSMTLNYDDMVRSNTANYNAYLRAPMRSAGEQETTLTRLRVADSQTHTDLYLFEGEQFSESFDNGWEATYMEGDGRSAKLYAQTETGDMAVAALPELEGTVLGFAPGKETEYTFTFTGAESGYYLNDLKLTTSTLISAENSYEFIFEDGDTNRFYISRTPINAPAITTGVENTKAEPKAQKVIVQDKMYILYNGHVYSAQGAVVR